MEERYKALITIGVVLTISIVGSLVLFNHLSRDTFEPGISLEWMVNNSIVKNDSIASNIGIKKYCKNNNIKLGENRWITIREKECHRIFPPCEYSTVEYYSYKLKISIYINQEFNWNKIIEKPLT